MKLIRLAVTSRKSIKIKSRASLFISKIISSLSSFNPLPKFCSAVLTSNFHRRSLFPLTVVLYLPVAVPSRATRPTVGHARPTAAVGADASPLFLFFPLPLFLFLFPFPFFFLFFPFSHFLFSISFFFFPSSLLLSLCSRAPPDPAPPSCSARARRPPNAARPPPAPRASPGRAPRPASHAHACAHAAPRRPDPCTSPRHATAA